MLPDHRFLPHLDALRILLEERHVSRAAKRMHITQSAMSKILARLREMLADELLIRVGNRLEPTPRALAILPHLDAMHREMTAIRAAGHFDPATCHRHFTIAVTDYVARFILPEAIGRLHREAPGITLSVRDWHAEHSLTDLVENRIQMVTCMGEDPLPAGVIRHWVGSDSFACLMRKEHPLAENLDLAGYCAFPHAAITGGSDKIRVIDTALSALGRKRTVSLLVSQFATAVEVIRSTDHLLTLPAHIGRHIITRHPLIMAPLPFSLPTFSYGLAWHERNKKDPAHIWFRECLFATFDAPHLSA